VTSLGLRLFSLSTALSRDIVTPVCLDDDALASRSCDDARVPLVDGSGLSLAIGALRTIVGSAAGVGVRDVSEPPAVNRSDTQSSVSHLAVKSFYGSVSSRGRQLKRPVRAYSPTHV